MELTVGFFKNSLELALDSVRCRRNLSKVGQGFGLRPPRYLFVGFDLAGTGHET